LGEVYAKAQERINNGFRLEQNSPRKFNRYFLKLDICSPKANSAKKENTMPDTTVNITQLDDATLLALGYLILPSASESCLPTLAWQELNRRGLAHPVKNPLNLLGAKSLCPSSALVHLTHLQLGDAVDFLQDFYFGDQPGPFENFAAGCLE
jgi:hypothetical protein